MDINDSFTFTRQERRGIAVFIIISIVIYCLGEFWPQKQPVPLELEQYYLPVDSASAAQDVHLNDYDDSPWEFNNKSESFVRQRFPFDPNNISYDSLLSLGFSKFASRNMTNYVMKGGKIKDEKKFKSIYGIDTNLVNDLGPLISYPNIPITNKTALKTEQKVETPIKNVAIVELNSADSLSLEAIKGVGPYMVKRILSYRKRLGGFLRKEQLTELKIIADSLYLPIQDFLTVDATNIDKININSADYKTFVTNPYFTKDIANAIIKYRKQHGDFSSVAHISRIKSLKESDGLKILPYLKVE